MMGNGRKNNVVATLIVGIGLSAWITGCRAEGKHSEIPIEQQQRLDALQMKRQDASLTIFPVVMGKAAFQDAAQVVALMLEQSGMGHLEAPDVKYQPANGASFDQITDGFGAFVRDQRLKTDYAVYAEFAGTPRTGPQEIRAILVDNEGQLVWEDRQTKSDRAFNKAKPGGPMDCCQFVAKRLRTALKIPKSARDNSGTGKFATLLAKNFPGPEKAEQDAMKKRLAVMKKLGHEVTVAVYPVRFSDEEVGLNDAKHLASFLNENKLCEARTVDSTWRMKIKRSRNEQVGLWDLARKFQEHIKQHPPEADYALLADYIFGPTPERVWAVHFVVCNRAGEWVIVDFQNDHHGDFQSVDPKTSDDCARLVVKRLQAYLR